MKLEGDTERGQYYIGLSDDEAYVMARAYRCYRKNECHEDGDRAVGGFVVGRMLEHTGDRGIVVGFPDEGFAVRAIDEMIRIVLDYNLSLSTTRTVLEVNDPGGSNSTGFKLSCDEQLAITEEILDSLSDDEEAMVWRVRALQPEDFAN